ncbi:hypothetical protein [Sphingomonas sp. PAMC 26605]|uniref:hypothetical protein n=1 Tax=Sphingomonas sp. PAMC 26605 TaxID=1112214 RepID=UPI00026CD11C|nr:hypothetical protein [Sphingomonas sp. PAMC 26605]
MPFLLLLSALLTALTGVVSGVRPVEISAQCPLATAGIQRLAVTVAPFVMGHRHLLGAFGLNDSFALAASLPALLSAAPRLYLDRPRA